MKRRAQYPFPNPLPKPVGAAQSFYYVAFGACLAASWADARGDLAMVDRFLDVAVEHMIMSAQAKARGLDEGLRCDEDEES